MSTQSLVKNMVRLVILMIQIENTKISVLEDSIVDYNICQEKLNETNENSGLHNLVSCVPIRLVGILKLHRCFKVFIGNIYLRKSFILVEWVLFQ